MKFLPQLRVALCGLLATGSSFAVAQDFPTSYSWTSTGPLISAKPDATHDPVSVKNPSAVYYNGQYLVYSSYITTTGGFGLEYWHFTDWSDAGAATPYYLDQTAIGGGYHSAPQVFYFAPQNLWYLIYQSPQPQYSTNSDPTQPQNWTAPKNFYATQPPGTSGWLDYWIICDSANCYLFFCDDGGKFFRSSTPIGDFPNGFNNPVVVYSESNAGNLFEASNVYTVEGTGEYLANIECIGPHRYFRALWASSLGGAWQAVDDTLSYSTPFLGQDNVTFDPSVSAWTDDFSSGGAVIVDSNADQTDSINLDNFTFLYQGVAPNIHVSSYGQIPYQLGLATSTGGSGTCEPTPIDAQMNVGGVWTAESSATVSSTSAVVDLGPQPLTGGSWSWVGPNGYKSTLREIDNIPLYPGANVYTATYTNSCGDTSTQAFTITAPGGSFSLAASPSSLSLVPGASTTDAITVTDSGGFTGTVTLTATSSNSGVTVTVSGDTLPLKASSTATGTATISVTGTSGSQTATTSIAVTIKTSGSPLIPNGTYVVTAVNSGLAIDDPGSSKTDGEDLQIYTVNDGTNQQWAVNNVSTNVITLTNVASGQLLDVAGASTAIQALVVQEPADGATHQEWNVISVAGGAFELTNVNSGLALDVKSGAATRGTGLDQYTYGGSTWQQWKFTSY